MIRRLLKLTFALGLPAFSFVSFAQSPTTLPVNSAPGGALIVKTIDKPAKKFDEKDYAGYVMVYFKDQTHGAYFAVSRDGYTFTDVNKGNPIFNGADIAEQKGVRDPHISRGPDGGFYLAMTDLHINARAAGRTTPFQRPEAEHGWGNNRALVLMKSYDLIHWTWSDVRVDLAFPELGDIDCSWAPQTIFDEKAGKMMIYFTIRYNNKECNIYWSYTDDAFTKLQTTPKMVKTIGGLDADIYKLGDKFHMHYVSDAKVWHAVSDKINDEYVAEKRRIDPETTSTEAPDTYKILGTSKIILMYDVYGLGNMGFSETADFVTYKNLGRMNDPGSAMKGTNFARPKHGAVTYLTLDELKAIVDFWKLDPAILAAPAAPEK